MNGTITRTSEHIRCISIDQISYSVSNPKIDFEYLKVGQNVEFTIKEGCITYLKIIKSEEKQTLKETDVGIGKDFKPTYSKPINSHYETKNTLEGLDYKKLIKEYIELLVEDFKELKLKAIKEGIEDREQQTTLFIAFEKRTLFAREDEIKKRLRE